MSHRPDYLVAGEKARLLPVLANRNKEGRSLSPFLAILSVVREYATEIFGQLGVRIGPRATIECFTEVCFATDRNAQDKSRPDGLIVIDTGKSQWRALVEAKIGDNDLTTEQVERYLDLAKTHRVDAVVTISNQFSPVPHHHPVPVNGHKTRSVSLFHFSWMHLLTVAELQLMNRNLGDEEQHWLLNELVRFVGEDSAGVRGFDQMPSSWKDIVGLARSGAPQLPDLQSREVVSGWQQECRDLELILSRQLGCRVSQKLSRKHQADPLCKIEDDLLKLKQEGLLEVELVVPDAASTLSVTIPIAQGMVINSVYLKAPGDKKTNKARLNWLLRQLPHDADPEVTIRAYWLGRSPSTEKDLASLRDDPSWLFDEKDDMQVVGFEVFQCVDLGARLAQPRTVIQQIEQCVPDFYSLVLEHLTEWQPAAPKIPEERSRPEDVSPSRLAEE